MNNNYKELNITKSLYRGSNDSFAERLERLDPTENYRGTELGSLDAFQRQLKRFDIQVGGSRSSTLEKFFQNGQSAVLFPEYLMRAVRQGMEENDPLSSVVAARTFISATDYRGLTTDDDLEADVTAEAAVCRHRALKIDRRAALKRAERRAPQALRHDIGGKAVARHGDHGQTHAVRRDAVANSGILEYGFRLYRQPRALRAVLDAANRADFFNNACKQIIISLRSGNLRRAACSGRFSARARPPFLRDLRRRPGSSRPRRRSAWGRCTPARGERYRPSAPRRRETSRPQAGRR